MRIGIVGSGFVGATTGYALVMRGLASRLTMVDANPERAEGEAMDLAHATPFAHPARVRAGEVEDLADSDLVLIAAGVGQKPGQTRLDLAAANARILRELVPRVVAAAPGALLLIATNPVDVLTQVAFQASGLPPSRVIGSGTTLDTARLRFLVGYEAGVSPKHVHGYVLGEHGDSELVAWSGLRVAGQRMEEVMAAVGRPWSDARRDAIERDVREAADRIIERKRATYYGAGAALARIVAAIADDEHAVLTVATSEGDAAYSLPRVLGRGGLIRTLDPHLDDAERAALARSVAVIRDVLARLD
jgi:L-lactate dehydrogenase